MRFGGYVSFCEGYWYRCLLFYFFADTRITYGLYMDWFGDAKSMMLTAGVFNLKVLVSSRDGHASNDSILVHCGLPRGLCKWFSALFALFVGEIQSTLIPSCASDPAIRVGCNLYFLALVLFSYFP